VKPAKAKPRGVDQRPAPKRYATNEEQLRELLEDIRRGNRRVYTALLTVLADTPPHVLRAVSVLVAFGRRTEARP
jgi:hypothetical protein